MNLDWFWEYGKDNNKNKIPLRGTPSLKMNSLQSLYFILSEFVNWRIYKIKREKKLW